MNGIILACVSRIGLFIWSVLEIDWHWPVNSNHAGEYYSPRSIVSVSEFSVRAGGQNFRQRTDASAKFEVCPGPKLDFTK